jgi:hypothetical protein
MTQVIERINRQQPDAFIVEQVPRVRAKKHRRFWKSLLDVLLGWMSQCKGEPSLQSLSLFEHDR